jgi:hypothetical protein
LADTVRIDRRFCGPPDSGNGGYVAGLLARELGSSDVAVTLRLPPPLDRDLEIGNDGGTAWLKDGDALIASAERQALVIDVPAPPAIEAAKAAEARYAGWRNHAFPGCFVCGPERSLADGLRIFPGAGDRGQVAAVWKPDDSLLDREGAVHPQFVWAALDCPGYWAVAGTAGIAVLGRFIATLHAERFAAEPVIVTGWPIRSEGRKHDSGTAIHAADGRLLAAAHATWITLK